MRSIKTKSFKLAAALALLALLVVSIPVLAGASSAAPTLAEEAPQPVEISAETQYAAAKDSVLYIRSYYASGSLKATGSGFVITPEPRT